jgi:hypothetical protein
MPSVVEEPRPLQRKMLHKPCLSRTTITAFVMLVTMAVLCQGANGQVLIIPENQTVVVDEEAVFFCQVLGEKGKIWFNRKSISDNPITWPADVHPRFDPLPAEQDSLRITNITLTVNALVQHNNSEVICTDELLGIAGGSYAYLTIQGGPGEPEVGYEVDRDEKEIVLSWPHPFTWEDYPITGYDIVCSETESENIVDNVTLNDTDILNEPVVNHTVDLPPYIPDCYTLQCNVTASNALDQSNISITDIYFPKMQASPVPAIELAKTLSQGDGKQEIIVCVKLPVLCVFQRVRYSVVISHGGDPVLELTRQFNYSSGYTSECIEEKVSGELEEGTEYSVQVFVDAGDSGNTSSPILTFKHRAISGKAVLEPQNGFEGSGDDSDDTAKTGLVVDIAMGTVMIIIIVILIIFAFIIIGMWRATKGNRSMVRSSRPAGATNKVFDHEALPLDREDGKTTAVEEPYYHTLDGSEQKARRPPSEPLYTTPFSDVNNKKK